MNNITKLLKRVLESLWLIVAIIAFGIAIKETLNVGFADSLIYYLFSGIASFFYFLRIKERQNQ